MYLTVQDRLKLNQLPIQNTGSVDGMQWYVRMPPTPQPSGFGMKVMVEV